MIGMLETVCNARISCEDLTVGHDFGVGALREVDALVGELHSGIFWQRLNLL
jgi:hypothetical protein